MSVSKKDIAPYILVRVTPAVIRRLADRHHPNLAVAFGNSRTMASPRIAAGDTIVLHIWEASTNGLFSGDTGSATTIPEQPVSSSGTITVPFVGTVRVLGLTTGQVQSKIQKSLQGKAIEPQVLVSVAQNVSNTATVLGEVAKSGRIRLHAPGERLLDVIADAGGPTREVNRLAVQITRGRRTENVDMQSLVTDPRQNIYVQPNDVITVVGQPRSFTVFGATTKNASVQFDESRLFLNQALAKVGGLDDERATAKGVFLYRSEPARFVASIAPQKTPLPSSGNVNVIYQIDLTDPNGFFLLKDFEVYNNDLVYVANSSLAEVRKFASLVGTAVSPVVQATVVSRAVK